MDLPLWDPSDQDYLASFKSNYHAGDVQQCGHYSGYEPDQSGYSNEDPLLCDFCFGCGRDLIEEDALNEKSCLQVLKILMDKADEDIVKLEEDIVMLQCQLAWDDEDWSVPCSAALREKIDHLDILIQSLKKESTEDVHYPDLQLEQPVGLPQSLHDLLNPLLENYLVKSKQTESSIIRMPVLPAVGLSKNKSEASTLQDNKKIEEKECTTMVKPNERKSQSMQLEERKLNDTQQPSNPMVKDPSASTSIEKANSRESQERRNNDKEVISKAKITQHGLQQESKVTNSHLKSPETEMQTSEIVKSADEILDSQVDCMKQRTEASSKVRKARVYGRAINKTLHSTKPLVKMKRKGTNFPETTEALEAQKTGRKYSIGAFNDRTEHAREPNMKLEHQIQVQQRHKIETLVINQARSFSSAEPEGQGPQMKCKADPEIVENLFVAENIDVGSSATENLKEQHKYGVLEKISKNGKKETQQQLNGDDKGSASEITVTSISSPQKVTELSFSQTTGKKKGLRGFLIKLVKTECDTSNSTTEEATDGVGDVAQNSSPYIKDVERLTLNDLKAIAKNRRMRGYSKLRKAELQKYLGLEPLNFRQNPYEKKGISPANTI